MSETEKQGFINAPATKLFIDTKMPSFSVLEGEYVSYAYGKSEDYVDLREYQDGDNAKDIDWRATARSQEPIIRRYREPKKHEIVFLVDSGINMNGAAEDMQEKKLLALTAAGMLMHIALQHNDIIRLCYKTATGIQLTPSTTSKSLLESHLKTINEIPKEEAQTGSSVKESLAFLDNTLKRRSIIICLSDIYATETANKELSHIGTRHNILWLSFRDFNIANNSHDKLYLDIETLTGYPETLRTDNEIIAAFDEYQKGIEKRATALLNSNKANYATVGRESEMLDAIFTLLHRQVRL